MKNQEISGKIIRMSDNCTLGIIGRKTLLKDINGKQLFIGDVVLYSFETDGCQYSTESIVCDIRGNIWGIWNTFQRDIENFNVKKIKNYTQLKDGEVYKDYNVKVVLDKPQNQIQKENEKQNNKIILQQQLQQLKKQVDKIEREIKREDEREKLKREENIKEDIAKISLTKTEEVKCEQYINESVVKFKRENIKVNYYTIRFKRDGRKIICTYGRGNTVGIGVAKCNSKDEFNYGKGTTIAELRARSDFYNKVVEREINKIVEGD